MAITKTIQATVKNRTDTAANWTQKNPVLAEGEIIVVQTSAGETRLKIGDGVKTFTQLPYTDEQIYNNVVTSVNGQTGDVILPGDFIVNATLTDDTNCTLDKTFAQIQEAIQSGKRVLANISGFLSTCMPLVLYSSGAVLFGATTTTSGNIELYTLAVTANEAKFVSKEAVTYGPDSTMPQVSMDSDPTADMQIATKKYVDDHVSADLYVDFWPTGSEQYNGNYNGYQIELATDQTFDAIFDSFKAGNKIVARLYKDADKSEETASSVDTAVTGTKEFGAIHFQFVTANADTGAIAGFPFIGEAIMMIKWEEAAVSYLIENRNVLPTPNADGTDNGKVPIINGTKWELKTPTGGGASDFVITGSLTEAGGITLDKTFAQIQEAVQAGKTALMRIDSGPTTITLPLAVKNSEISTEYDFSIGYFIEGRLNGVTVRVMESGPVLYTASTPTNNPDGTMPQVSMAADPTTDMQIATKKYVDDKISDKEIILSSSTAGSTKKFKLTIDDTGTLTASEITA